MINSLKTVSKKQNNFLEKAVKISLEGSEEVGFVVRSMVSASMPHSRVKGCSFKRNNSNFILTINGNEEAGGVPYGTYPRLILSWITSEALKTKSREIILGKSLSKFMKSLGLSVTGGKWGTVSRFKEQLKMLFSSTISLNYMDNGQWISSSMSIADRFHLLWNPENPNEIDLFGSKIFLGEVFFNEIISSPIPVDLRAINALKESSLALDIYFWLTYRMSHLYKQTDVSYEKLHMQFGIGYEQTTHGKYEFKRKFLIQLKKVLVIYSNANVNINQHCIQLLPSKTHIKKIK